MKTKKKIYRVEGYTKNKFTVLVQAKNVVDAEKKVIKGNFKESDIEVGTVDKTEVFVSGVWEY